MLVLQTTAYAQRQWPVHKRLSHQVCLFQRPQAPRGPPGQRGSMGGYSLASIIWISTVSFMVPG